MIGGAIDVDAIAALAQPMRDLSAAVQRLSRTVDSTNSPWLFGPFQDKLVSTRNKLDSASLQVQAGEAAAAAGPAMLGASGPRKYLVVFTSPGEARGQSGLIGNYAELTVDRGTLSQTGFGRTSRLMDALRESPPFALAVPPEYLAAYGPYGAADSNGMVTAEFWPNVTMSPDMPSVGSAMAQMYSGSGLGELDGVFVIDVYGLAALVKVTGPVTIPGTATSFTTETLQNFLLYDQYTQPEDVRRDQLAAIADATFGLLLRADLPVPEKVARELGPSATEGHIVGWAKRPEEQDLLVRIGMAGRLPAPDDVGGLSADSAGLADGLAIVTNNASGSKIDSFLERSETYTGVYDPATGWISVDLEVIIKNNAPPGGYDDYVIGSKIGLPLGTNRTLLTVYSPLNVDSVMVNDVPVASTGGSELGWHTTTVMLDVGTGDLATVTLQLSGAIAKNDYRFVWRPQPLTRPDSLALSVRSTNGDQLAVAAGQIKRLSVVSVSGTTAIR